MGSSVPALPPDRAFARFRPLLPLVVQCMHNQPCDSGLDAAARPRILCHTSRPCGPRTAPRGGGGFAALLCSPSFDGAILPPGCVLLRVSGRRRGPRRCSGSRSTPSGSPLRQGGVFIFSRFLSFDGHSLQYASKYCNRSGGSSLRVNVGP